MKIINILFLLFFSISFAQTATYGKLTKKADFKVYIAKNEDTLKIGDTLTIGAPTSNTGFVYITQGGLKVPNESSKKKVIIERLKTRGNEKKGYQMYAQYKGFGFVPVLIEYDMAFEVGEIKNSNTKLTKEQAISKLKEAKVLLDLELMNQSEYDKLKSQLKPAIMN